MAKRILILGAGFGGLFTALELGRRLRAADGHELTLLDARTYHMFSPLLHEVTSGIVEPRHVTWPVRALAGRHGFRFENRRVRAIDLDGRLVRTDHGDVPYEYLVIALGSVTEYFDVRGAERWTLPFKSLHDAMALRSRLLQMFEEAALEPDPERRRRLLRFVLVGAGCTGVELATEIDDLARRTLLRHYPGLDPAELSIVVAEASGRIIPCVSDGLARLGLEKLAQRGIQVRLHAPVVAVEEGAVVLRDGERVPSATIVWAAGVRANPVIEALPVEKDKQGRVVVDPTLELPPYPGVFVLGDGAHLRDPGTGRPLPPTAQVAVQQARTAAGNILRDLRGQPKLPFRYRHRSDLVSLGAGDAVGEIAGLRFTGWPAWLLWRSVFLAKLSGWKNRIRVAVDWIMQPIFGRDLTQIDG
jgi:NADH dehydrogenase